MLTGLEQFAGNGDITDRLKKYGFVHVVRTTSGSTPRFDAAWNGHDTTAQLDSHPRDIARVSLAAAPSSGATNATSAPALLVAGDQIVGEENTCEAHMIALDGKEGFRPRSGGPP